jgi:hypothetical protein
MSTNFFVLLSINFQDIVKTIFYRLDMLFSMNQLLRILVIILHYSMLITMMFRAFFMNNRSMTSNSLKHYSAIKAL